MRSTLKHLPEGKREDLRRLTETIREMCDDVEMVAIEVPDFRGRFALLGRTG